MVESENKVIENEEFESIMCAECGGTPCDWILYGNEIISGVELMYEEDPQKGQGDMENRCIRKSADTIFMKSMDF